MFQQCIPIPKDTVRPPETVLVNVNLQETRVAITEKGQLCELHVERHADRGLVGNIYVGVVRRVLPGMQSAFIDIGLDRSAFLHIVDMLDYQEHIGNVDKRIERMIFEGQRIVVQVIKDPIGTKGARLSTRISLAGRYLVHLPQDEHIGVSQKIESDEEREALRKTLDSLLPKDECHGYIVRTSAESASVEDLQRDINYLTRIWRDTLNKSMVSPGQTLVYQELFLGERVLRDMVNEETREILVDDMATYLDMKAFAAKYVPDMVDKIVHYVSPHPIFSINDIERQIDKALDPRVNLEDGGYLIVETTEAMTTIDVNTGGYVGKDSFAETIFKTNLEACQAIANAIRVRNIGGIIIVDFIDMDNEEHQVKVLEELAKALSLDRTRVTLNGFTSLGLVELTRKRTRDSLAHALMEVCPTCHGRGKVKSLQTVCFDIMRIIYSRGEDMDGQVVKIIASSAIVDFFLNEEADAIKRLGAKLNANILFQVDAGYTQEEYDLVTMNYLEF